MITITDKAVSKIQELQAEDELKGLIEGKGVGNRPPLRVGVRSGGCSGFLYDLFFDFKGVRGDDLVQDFDGVVVVVDPESVIKLEGVVLDFSEGLQHSGFKFTNSGAERTCGCGSSFS